MASCFNCHLALTKGSGVRCSQCMLYAHLNCVQMKQEDITLLKSMNRRWKCGPCIKKSTLPTSPVMPPRATSPVTESPEGGSSGSPATGGTAGRSSRGADVSASLVEINSALRSLTTNYGDIVKSLDELHLKFDDQSDVISSLQEKLDLAVGDMELLKQRNDKLEGENERLKSRLNQLEQNALDRSLDIHGVQETQGETAAATVIRVGHHLGLKLASEAIESCYRFGKFESGKRAIAVRFVFKRDRDEFLRCKKAKRDLTMDNSKIFVNESLTPYNRQIYGLARRAKAATEGGFKYLWIRDGQIYGKAGDGKRSFKIKTEEDLQLVK